MTVSRAFLIVIASTVGFGLAGGLIGFGLGTVTPSYYRTVFRHGTHPAFDPAQVGVGLGLSQGLAAGVAVGLVIVLAVAWYNGRAHAAPTPWENQ